MTNPLKTSQFPAFAGGRLRSLQDRLRDGAVNVAEMPDFVGNPSAGVDDAPWAACAAKAYTEKKSMWMPDGCQSKVTDSIFAGDIDNPTNASFSMGVVGMGNSLGNDTNRGSQIVTTFNDKPALIIGPGQGMCVGNLSIMGPGAEYRGQQHKDGIGVALSSGAGGISRGVVENVGVANFHTLYQTGYEVGEGSGALCDSISFRKCFGYNAARGIYWSKTQNFIQEVDGCSIHADIGLYNPLGINVEVISSNLSATHGRAGVYTIANVVVDTPSAVGNSFLYGVAATVTNPDANLEIVDADNVPLILKQGQIFLTGFGVVPFTVTTYDVATQEISLLILAIWGQFHYGENDITTATDIVAELEAATSLDLAEKATTFYGSGFKASSVHIENPSIVWTLLDATVSFDSGTALNHFDQIYCNSSPDNPTSGTAGEIIAKRRTQLGHPFISLTGAGLIFENSEINNDTDGINIDIGADLTFEARNIKAMKPPNMRTYIGSRARQSDASIAASGSGAGIWCPTPFVPPTGAFNRDAVYRTTGGARGEYWGWYPAKDRHPRLTTAQLAAVNVAPESLPALVTGSSPDYVNLFGNTIYSVLSDDSGTLAEHFARSAHKGGSWGQNFTTSNVTNLAWHCKGKSHVIFVNAEMFERLIPGFVYKFNINGSDQEVLLTGMSPREGYITVMPWDGSLLAGTKTEPYSGMAIGQQPYVIETF